MRFIAPVDLFRSTSSTIEAMNPCSKAKVIGSRWSRLTWRPKWLQWLAPKCPAHGIGKPWTRKLLQPAPYAMAHPARPATTAYHLGDTTRWQVFGGDKSTTTASRSATRETSGIILSYSGGIVERLYASNAQVSAEAHGDLGASMSKTGAQRLARQGLPCNAILGRYNARASLARLTWHDQ